MSALKTGIREAKTGKGGSVAGRPTSGKNNIDGRAGEEVEKEDFGGEAQKRNL